VVNPNGRDFLARDVRNVAQWFRSRGLPEHVSDPEALTAMLASEARIG
jgi:RIO kinase 1